jgi:tyrosyl-tRNA synthetase
LIAEHKNDAAKRSLQKKLAEEVTKFVHGEEELKKAIETTEKLFSNPHSAIEDLTVEELEGMDGIIKVDFEKGKIAEGIDVVTFLAETKIFPSKGEARKTVQGGGVSINRKKIENIQQPIENNLLLHDRYILVQKGKKNYYLVNCN